jgi:hypothetical protein
MYYNCIKILLFFIKIQANNNLCDLQIPIMPRVVTRMIEDGRTNGWTMAAGSYVTWTHYSIRYKVVSGVNRRVRADEGVHPRGRELRPR